MTLESRLATLGALLEDRAAKHGVVEQPSALVGFEVPVGAGLDLHCHVTARMVEQATALVGYKEYPHVDVMDRMLDLFAILADTEHLWPLVEDPFASS